MNEDNKKYIILETEDIKYICKIDIFMHQRKCYLLNLNRLFLKGGCF